MNIAINNKRNPGIDVARGIAICLMVVGHCYSDNNIILQWIYSFHMPFFFLISGIYASKSLEINKHIKKLLVPYYVFEILYDLFLAILGFHEGIITVFLTHFKKTLLWEGNSATWFLPCLFLVYLWHYMISKIHNNYYRIAIALCIMLGGGLYISEMQFAVPIMRSLISFGFYEIGVFLKEKFLKKISIVELLVLQAIFVLLFIFNGMVSLYSLDFGKSMILYVVNGILGSYLLVQYSCLTTVYESNLIKSLIFLGQNTMVILTTHKFIIEIIRLGDYIFLGSILHCLGYLEGIVFGLIVLILETPIIYFGTKYFGVLFGKNINNSQHNDSIC